MKATKTPPVEPAEEEFPWNQAKRLGRFLMCLGRGDYVRLTCRRPLLRKWAAEEPHLLKSFYQPLLEGRIVLRAWLACDNDGSDYYFAVLDLHVLEDNNVVHSVWIDRETPMPPNWPGELRHKGLLAIHRRPTGKVSADNIWTLHPGGKNPIIPARRIQKDLAALPYLKGEKRRQALEEARDGFWRDSTTHIRRSPALALLAARDTDPIQTLSRYLTRSQALPLDWARMREFMELYAPPLNKKVPARPISAWEANRIPRGEYHPPLWQALHDNNYKLAQFLIDCGADPNAVDEDDPYSDTPLLVSCPGGHRMLKFLIDNGADVNRRPHHGVGILHWIAGGNRVSLARYVMERGADVNSRDQARDTPLHHALRSEDSSLRMVSFLLKHGADPNARGQDGITPLHLAVWLESKLAVPVTRALLRHGADPNRKDRARKTPLQHIEESEYGDRSALVRMLRRAMARSGA